MLFVGIDNPFGTVATEPTIESQPRTLYYKGMRLNKMPVRVPRTPKPLSHAIKNFLLTYDK